MTYEFKKGIIEGYKRVIDYINILDETYEDVRLQGLKEKLKIAITTMEDFEKAQKTNESLGMKEYIKTEKKIQKQIELKDWKIIK